MDQTLHLIDGSNWVCRAFFGCGHLMTTTGIHCGAVFGFSNMLIRLFVEHHPERIAVVFDAGGRSDRKDLYPQYKSDRREAPAELPPQFSYVRQVIRAFGVPTVDARDCEADDMIACLTRKALDQGLNVVIETSDKDLMQLVRNGRVLVYDTKALHGDGEVYGEEQVEEKFGVGPRQLGDWLSLRGDSVDNIPGVPGVGEKKATALLRQWGSIDTILANLPRVGKVMKEQKMRGAESVQRTLSRPDVQASLQVARSLVALRTHIDNAPEIEALQRGRANVADLKALFERFEFTSLLPMFD